MNAGYQQARVTSVVADRITEAFRGGPADTPDGSTAKANDNLSVELHVPPGYKLNLPHFLAWSG